LGRDLDIHEVSPSGANVEAAPERSSAELGAGCIAVICARS